VEGDCCPDSLIAVCSYAQSRPPLGPGVEHVAIGAGGRFLALLPPDSSRVVITMAAPAGCRLTESVLVQGGADGIRLETGVPVHFEGSVRALEGVEVASVSWVQARRWPNSANGVSRVLDGRFQIRDVPRGEYDLLFEWERDGRPHSSLVRRDLSKSGATIDLSGPSVMTCRPAFDMRGSDWQVFWTPQSLPLLDGDTFEGHTLRANLGARRVASESLEALRGVYSVTSAAGGWFHAHSEREGRYGMAFVNHSAPHADLIARDGVVLTGEVADWARRVAHLRHLWVACDGVAREVEVEPDGRFAVRALPPGVHAHLFGRVWGDDLHLADCVLDSPVVHVQVALHPYMLD
jgi:hypothetical protein